MKKRVLMILSLLMMLTLAASAMAQTGEPESKQSAASCDYTVEFTYEGKQYVMPGDSSVRLSAILDGVGLTGEVSAVEVSDESLLSAKKCKTAEGGNTPEKDKDGNPIEDENGTWFVFAHQPFSSNEWMKVTIGGVAYEITVTDAQGDYDISTGFITINSGNVGSWNGKTITGSVSQTGDIFPQGPSDGATNYRSAICIDGVSVNLTIRDLSIVAIFDNNVGAYKVSPILLLNGATLNLTLEGSNTLTACVGGAGICVPDSCALNIGGSGSLVARGGDGGASEQLYHCLGGAAIGAEDKPLSSELKRTGSITINGGTINATGGAAFSNRGGSAGIGGSGKVDGIVTINGGNVTAEGGDYAAGIGGGIAAGGTITINGGTVKAIANTAGSAIGSGAGTNTSTIAINGGNVTANGNIGSPGTGSGGSRLTVDFSRAVIACEGNGRVNCSNAAIQTFTVTVYDAALTQGDHACTFWVNEKNINSAAMPATLSVSEAGVGTATVKCLVIYDSYSMRVTGHLQIGNATYDTAAVQMSPATTSMSLYSGYRVTLTGTVYDADIASGQTGTVSVEGVTLASQSVSTSASKATVSAVFYLKEGAVDDGNLTKNVSVTVGGKTYSVGDVTFAKSATHQKSGSFTIREGGVDYVKLDGEVEFVSPYTVIESGTTTWTGDNGGFYAAPAGQSVTINDQVKVYGNVNLVLTDGSTLTAAKGIDMGTGSSLTIWRQSDGTGKLLAEARTDDTYAPGIGPISANNSSITINGGTVEAMGRTCPGIGGDSYCDNLNITINAGKVTAKGSDRGGEGIGSKSGTITINGGTVVATASGDGCAGIWSESGSIRINGGHVTATGTGTGAAIGGEAVRGTGSIAISGGTVVANAVSDGTAAAIGGGNKGGFSSITISGGNVTANGGKYAAAIGGGIRSTAGSATIEITGGTVRANGGSSAAGIGNGWEGKCAITTTLSYDNASSDMSVYASSYQFKNDDATNTVKLSKAFKDAESGRGFAATDSAVLTDIAGKTLVPAESYGVIVDSSITNGTVSANPSRAVKDAVITLTVKPDTENGYKLKPGSLKATYAGGEVFLTQDGSDPMKYTFTMPAADVTVTAVFTNHVHAFTYTANSATITATCGNEGCDLTENPTLTINAPTGSLTYDGTAKTATVTGEIPGVTTPEIAYTKKGDASFTGTPTAAGAYTASITLENATASVSYTIEPKPVTITGLSAENKEYDGTTAATITGTGTIEGNISGDDVRVDTSAGTATFDSADVGMGKTVTFSGYALTGANAGNYTLSEQPASVTANITARAITITAKPQSVELNSEIATGTDQVSITGDLADSQSLSTISLALAEGKNTNNAGEYDSAIVPSGAVIVDVSDASVNLAGNYSITYQSGKLTVAKVKAKVTTAPTANNRTYDGTGADLLTGGNADTSLEYSTDGTNYSATVPQGTNADTYTVHYRAAADGNHDAGDAVEMTVFINKAPLTVTANNWTITYGDAPANDGVIYSGFVNGETESVLGGTLEYEYSYTQFGDVGSSYSITPGGLAAENYEISFAPGKLTVGQKEVGLLWDNTPLTFNGSAQAPAATATGLVNGDVISVTVSGAQTDAGTGYTATAIGLTGGKAGNYKLPSENTTTFDIGKAAAQTLADVTVSQMYSLTSVSASLAGKMPDNAGQLTYAKGTESKKGSVTVSGWDVNSSGTVTATLSGGAAGDTVTLPVTIRSTNYADSTVNVVVTLKAKDDAGVSISDPPHFPLEYCDVLALTGSVQNPGTNGTWTWTSSAPEVLRITPNGADAVIEALNAGTATITASYESDTTIGSSTTVLITVNPKPLTITANNQNILVHDELPALDDYQVEGFLNQDALTTAPTLVYQKNGETVTPDNTAAGTYDIVPSGANAGNNYKISYVNGILTISEKKTQTITAEAVTAAFGDTGKSVSASVTDPATDGGAISYAVKSGSEDYIDVDASTGALTIKLVGTATVVVTAAETATYAAATKEVTVTINKVDAAVAAVTANNRTYDGTEKPLVTVTGEATGGEMQYALGTATEATQPYTTSIPTGTNAGTYYVWYRVAGDENHTDTQPISIEVTISTVPVFSVLVTDDGNGTASANPASGETGTEVTLTAEAKEGYRFREWQVISGGVTVTDNRFRIGSANAEIRAVFEEIPEEPAAVYTVTVINDDNGTASANPASGETGTEVTLTAEAKEGYRFREWQVISGGITVTDNRFTIGSANAEIRAVFEEIPEEPAAVYTVTVFNDGSGTASANPASGETGTEVTLTAEAKEGYRFREWQVISGGVTVTDNRFRIGSANAEIRAVFEKIPVEPAAVYTVTVLNDGNGTASANPASGETGTEVTLTAEAKEGYRFREWQVISGGVTVTDNRFRIGSANAEIRAVFEKIPEEPVQPVTYATVSAVGAMHTIGSGENAVITVERSTGDKRELELFTGAAVDGIPVPDGSYSAAKGSLILTLKSAYLDTLREGEHKVTISFRDGSAEAALTIRRTGEPAVTTLPKTGDGAKPVLWLGMIAAGLAVAFVAGFVKKRRDR